jgi:acyl-coenzyme A thioesterase PaaI-like protein
VSPPSPSDAPARGALVPPPDAQPPQRHPRAPEPGTPLGSHYDHCFGCGNGQPHGLHMDVTAGEGVHVTAEFTVQPAHQGAPGLAHGGVLAAALDETLGALSWLLRRIMVTARLQTDYVRPVPVGAVLHLSARCTAVSGRKVYCSGEGRLGAPDGPVAIRADALFVEVGSRHFTEHGRQEEIDAVVRNPDQVKAARAFEVNP